jgi:thioesterase domain-containing protein
MSAAEIEAYLHTHIPLSRAMGVRVVTAAPAQVTLRAPLEPNINHRDTVFGGSAVAVATLAAWALLHVRLQATPFAGRIVIQYSHMSYDRPISGDFTASTSAPDAAAWQRFAETLKRKGRARIALQSEVDDSGGAAAHFEGDFVVLAARQS